MRTLLEVCGEPVEFEDMDVSAAGHHAARISAVRTGSIVHVFVDGRYVTTCSLVARDDVSERVMLALSGAGSPSACSA